MAAVPDARFTTLAISGAYDHAESAHHIGALSESAHLATAQSFPSMEAMLAATAENGDGWVYTRRGNPTVRLLEHTVAALEGYRVDAAVSATLTATGMGAITLATMPLLSAAAGDKPNIVASPQCYGSTTMVFDKRYGQERGVDVRWVGDPLNVEDWARHIDGETRFLYAEVPSNPTVQLVDIPALSELAREAGIPLIIDATLATPVLMRPLALGADIVVHSLTKAAGASGRSMGGAVIARHGLELRGQPAELSADYAGHLRRGPCGTWARSSARSTRGRSSRTSGSCAAGWTPCPAPRSRWPATSRNTPAWPRSSTGTGEPPVAPDCPAGHVAGRQRAGRGRRRTGSVSSSASARQAVSGSHTR